MNWGRDPGHFWPATARAAITGQVLLRRLRVSKSWGCRSCFQIPIFVEGGETSGAGRLLRRWPFCGKRANERFCRRSRPLGGSRAFESMIRSLQSNASGCHPCCSASIERLFQARMAEGDNAPAEIEASALHSRLRVHHVFHPYLAKCPRCFRRSALARVGLQLTFGHLGRPARKLGSFSPPGPAAVERVMPAELRILVQCCLARFEFLPDWPPRPARACAALARSETVVPTWKLPPLQHPQSRPPLQCRPVSKPDLNG